MTSFRTMISVTDMRPHSLMPSVATGGINECGLISVTPIIVLTSMVVLMVVSCI
jgi:hypothetical protein